MTRLEIIKTLAQKTGYSQEVVRNVFKALLSLIFQRVSENGKMTVFGLGRFWLKYTPSRIMRSHMTNLQPHKTKGSRSVKFRQSLGSRKTGETIKFKQSLQLKETVNFKRIAEEDNP